MKLENLYKLGMVDTGKTFNECKIVHHTKSNILLLFEESSPGRWKIEESGKQYLIRILKQKQNEKQTKRVYQTGSSGPADTSKEFDDPETRSDTLRDTGCC